MSAEGSSEGIVTPDGLPAVYARDRAVWRAWLAENHEVEHGAWLVMYKKGTDVDNVTYDEAVEEAVAFGWIDSRANRVDDARYIQFFARRKPRSVWSRSNRERFEKLMAEGRMAPAGIAAVEAAKANGQWDALTDVQSHEMPDDLARALSANPVAAANFDAFAPSSKRIILVWIGSAKRPETRAARVEETVRLAADNIRANHPRPSKGT